MYRVHFFKLSHACDWEKNFRIKKYVNSDTLHLRY